MARYDGEIRFNTKIDEKGFNKGTASMGDKLKNLGSSIASFAASGVAVFLAILAVVGMVVKAIGKFFRGVVNGVKKIIELGERTQAVKNEFANLRASVRNAFLPLLQFALPLLQQVAAWLTKIFNFIGMVLGALTGQRTIMRATADAAADAAGSSGKLAKNTEDAEKAAKGALASFDDLNVLQMEEPPQDEPTGGGGVGGAGFEMIPIDEGILAFFDKLLEKLKPLTTALQGLWGSVVELWGVMNDALKPLWESLGIQADNLLTALILLATNGVEWLTLKIQQLTEWIRANPEEFRLWATAVLVAVGLLVGPFILMWLGVIAVIGLVGAAMLSLIAVIITVIGAIVGIIQNFSEVVEQMKIMFAKAMIWIKTKVIDPLKAWFGEAWLSIQTGFKTAWEGILTFFKGIINRMIGFMNRFIRGVVSGINSIISGFNSISVKIPNWVPLIGGNSFGVNIRHVSAPQIPRLASGAVIPPNSEFLAVLGDQRAGRNIETPEGLMRQIVREELAGMIGGGEDINVTMPVYLDSEKIYEGQKRVERRRGSSLVTGGSIA
ncbi:MAG: hypothetical protein SVT56_04925 [Chloroflexota bacterium]|nr:hypothetical protein [Chloroflexota bacterium]